MTSSAYIPRRNELINFLPILTLAFAIFLSEGLKLDIIARVFIGVHIVAFYWISIRMVFKKNFSKLVILLILFPATAVFTYIVMLFLRPQPRQESRQQEQEQ